MNVPELWNYLGPANPPVLALIARVKALDVSVTPNTPCVRAAVRIGLFRIRSAGLHGSQDSLKNPVLPPPRVSRALMRGAVILGKPAGIPIATWAANRSLA